MIIFCLLPLINVSRGPSRNSRYSHACKEKASGISGIQLQEGGNNPYQSIGLRKRELPFQLQSVDIAPRFISLSACQC